MKKWIFLITFTLFIQQTHANPWDPREASENDKSVCRFNNTEVELETTSISNNNPEYRKAAELMPGYKVEFSQLYRYYGMRTFVFNLLAGQKILTTAETTLEGNSNPPFAKAHPSLTLETTVTMNNQEYSVRCDYIIDGNNQNT
jgi:hypothetical protein